MRKAIEVSQHIVDFEFPEAYKAGFHCGKYGPTEENSKSSYFENDRSKLAWERGKSDAQKKV